MLIDIGFLLNICPLRTLTRLEVDLSRMQTWKKNMKAYDGFWRVTIRDIALNMVIGPVIFSITFQTMDISASYNILPRQSWIYMAGALHSMLHQCHKFMHDHQGVVIHGERGHPI